MSALAPRSAGAAVLALALAACDGSAPDAPRPPRPASMAGFDPRAAARIEQALAAVDAEPASARAWAELGTVYLSERLKTQSAECLAVAERLDPREPRWAYRGAIVLAQSGDLAGAKAAMGRALALEPSYAPGHARLGNYSLDLGDLDGAEASYRRATELDAANPAGWLGLARVALQRERAPEAVAILERLQASEPENRTIRQLLSSARRQVDPSLPLSEESVLADEEAQVWNDPWEAEMRGFVRTPAMLEVGHLIDAGRAREALALLEDERARGGDEDEIAFLVATAHERLGDGAAARAEIEPLLARQPDNVRALLLRARLADDANDIAQVVATLRRVTELQPTNGGAFAALGTKLVALGEHEAGAAACERAIELGVRDYAVRSALAGSLVGRRKWPEASALLAKLLEERPENGDAWLQLALVHVRTGAFDEAVRAFERAEATGNASPKLRDNVKKAIDASLERARGGG